MPIITINGTIGSGTFEVGQMVANSLNLNYVDRMVLAEAAKRVGSPVGVLVEKEQRVIRFRERLGRFLQTMLERSAISGVSGEPYFGRGIEMLPAETYSELAGDPSSSAQRVNDQAFIESTTSVIKEVADGGNVVIIGRGSNMILAGTPDVFNVSLVAPMEYRVENIMRRENLSHSEATAYVEELEEARLTFFRKFFKVNANDSGLYHMVLNTGLMDPETAVDAISRVVGVDAGQGVPV